MKPSPTGWRKSSRSQQVSSCVEVGKFGSGAAVRDTKDRADGYLAVDAELWSGFLLAIKSGRYER